MKILFVSHEASATGAPIFLLNFAKWLRENVKNLNIHTIVLKDDTLLNQWQNLGGVTFAQGLGEIELTKKLKEICSVNNAFDIIYFNTIETSHILNCFVKNSWFGISPKTILHVHELECTIQKYGPGLLRKVSAVADCVIVDSEIVGKNLVNYGFKFEQLNVIYPCSNDLSAASSANKSRRVPDKVKSLNVLGCGYISLIKGTDLFLQVCNQVKKLSLNLSVPIKFIWLGQDLHGVKSYLVNDIEKMELDNEISFIDYQESIDEVFAQADVFFLSSREDSCPLVCLEAASLGLPIVYFKGSGGMDEVLSDVAGFPVPYMDVGEAARTIVELLVDTKGKGNERGRKAREVYLKRHTPHIVYSEIFNKICVLNTRIMECLN